jgi:hypothetical protein
MKTRIVLVGGAVALLSAVGATSAPARVANDAAKDNNKTVTADCINMLSQQKEGTFTWSGPTYAWPPNHKYRSATITLTDEDDEPLTEDVTIEAVATHDEMVGETGELNGAGHTDPATDAVGGAGGGTGSASTPVQFRGERSGRGDGRTYDFLVEGTTDTGLSECAPVHFYVEVPHDLGQGSGKKSARRRALRLRAR